MTRKMSRIGLPGTFYPSLHAGSLEDRVLGFRVPQQNAIIRSGPCLPGRSCTFPRERRIGSALGKVVARWFR